MTCPHDELPNLSTLSSPVLRPAHDWRKLQKQHSVVRVRTYAGDEAWLVTRHAAIKTLMLDNRLGRWHPDPANAPKFVSSPLLAPVVDGDAYANEVNKHRKARAVLTPLLSRKRITDLEPAVTALVDDAVEALAIHGPPADLQKVFANKLSMAVLCELIGVPDADRDELETLFYQAVATFGGDTTTTAALAKLMFGLIAERRANPQDDLISGICEAGLTDAEVSDLVLSVLLAGHGSVASHLVFGVARLCTDDELRATVGADPGLMTTTVEELLRTASGGGGSIPHYARENFEIDGVEIRAGDLVLVDFALANFDPEAFEDPDRIDLTRSPNPHLTFAHGMWHCVGAPLARMQLRLAFTALFARFPNLRLVRPLSELTKPSNQLAGGLSELPVTW